jgi:hypothetical protein
MHYAIRYWRGDAKHPTAKGSNVISAENQEAAEALAEKMIRGMERFTRLAEGTISYIVAPVSG